MQKGIGPAALAPTISGALGGGSMARSYLVPIMVMAATDPLVADSRVMPVVYLPFLDREAGFEQQESSAGSFACWSPVFRVVVGCAKASYASTLLSGRAIVRLSIA